VLLQLVPCIVRQLVIQIQTFCCTHSQFIALASQSVASQRASPHVL
jgi:hypothetical protein